MARELLVTRADRQRVVTTVAVLVLVTAVARARAIDAQALIEKELMTELDLCFGLGIAGRYRHVAEVVLQGQRICIDGWRGFLGRSSSAGRRRNRLGGAWLLFLAARAGSQDDKKPKGHAGTRLGLHADCLLPCPRSRNRFDCSSWGWA